MSHRNGMLCPTCKQTYALYRKFATGKCQDCAVKHKNFNFWLIVGLIDRVKTLEDGLIRLKASHHNHLKWHLEDVRTALTSIDAGDYQTDVSKVIASLLNP